MRTGVPLMVRPLLLGPSTTSQSAKPFLFSPLPGQPFPVFTELLPDPHKLQSLLPPYTLPTIKSVNPWDFQDIMAVT